MLASLLGSCDSPAKELLSLLGLSAPPVDHGHPSPREVASRRQMFERLVSDVRRLHVFSSVWSEADWSNELPALEREVLGAPGREGLLLALHHVSNSLRDGHLQFTPAGAQGTEEQLTLPIAFTNAGESDAPAFVVSVAERGSGASLGDRLLRYDGVPWEELLEHYRLELDAATPAARTQQLGAFLHQHGALGRPWMEGATVPITLRHGAHVVDVELELQRTALPLRGEDPTGAVEARPACPLPAREYDAEYELVDVGTRVCMYRAFHGPFQGYPIVRHVSFRYLAEQREADRDRVQRFLAAIPDIAGVLVDMRANGGGAAADYILPWYSAAPYRGLGEWVHLDAHLTDRARLQTALRSADAADEYLRRAAGGERWWVRPFDCGSEPCTSQQARPPLVSAPLALLLGPGCRSACDSFAALWTRQQLGPTIGSSPSAMYTSLRYPLEVKLGNEPLGDFWIALCGLRFEDGEPWLEGRPLRIDSVIEPAWPPEEHRAKLLRAAIEALQGWGAQRATR